MKVYEFGKQNKQIFVMFQCAVEPWWTFESSAKLLAHEFHVFLFITDGHDETGSEFTSLEHSVKQSAEWMKENGIDHIDIMYGVSMGGAGVIRFLATEQIKVEKAIIDAGITPYTYPKIICRLISFWDFISISMASKNLTIMKMAMPPEKWTPKGENPEEHYKKILRFEKTLSSRTIYNIFWSTNNYEMLSPMPKVDTEIEYWYGEKEKNARKNDIKYTCQTYPQTVVREFKGLEHAELVLMYPDRFCKEVKRFKEEEK